MDWTRRTTESGPMLAGTRPTSEETTSRGMPGRRSRVWKGARLNEAIG
jgi:hypothetical protein